ncbi:hypothetical protein BZA70DRAFT_289490 [Myxozyma melibiosi]|uniref:Ell binding protein Ebp1 C-terminal domain-containing protein n=1 Tax=Myxozyma melibiosi TaxID=54550 RepID=A0ABR1F6V0_9ASCO
MVSDQTRPNGKTQNGISSTNRNSQTFNDGKSLGSKNSPGARSAARKQKSRREGEREQRSSDATSQASERTASRDRANDRRTHSALEDDANRTTSSKSRVVDSKSEKSTKRKTLPREEIDYPLTPLLPILSPTLPPVFDLEPPELSLTDADSVPDWMISPTLPPVFDASVPESPIPPLESQDGVGRPLRSVDVGSLLEKHRPSLEPRKRKIVVLRLPLHRGEVSKMVKKETHGEVAHPIEAKPAHNDGPSTADKRIKELEEQRRKIEERYRKEAETERELNRKLEQKMKKMEENAKELKRQLQKRERDLVREAELLTSKKVEEERARQNSVSPTKAEKVVMTPPPTALSSATIGEVASTPGTPNTKKSTLAEYNNKRKTTGDEAPADIKPSAKPKGTPDPASSKTSTPTTGKPQQASNDANKSSAAPSANRKMVQLLEAKVQHWLTLATDRKHASDRQKEGGDLKLASVYAMDALLAYLVAFDYDDKCASIKGRVPSDKNWATLVPYARHVIKLHDQSNSSALAGATYLIRAIVYLRVAGFHQKSARALQHAAQASSSSSATTDGSSMDQRDSQSPETSTSVSGSYSQTELIDLLLKFSKNVDLAAYEFQRGSRLIPVDVLMSQFPETWRKRVTSVSGMNAIASSNSGSSGSSASAGTFVHLGGSVPGPGLRPLDDNYMLPIQMTSSVREAAAFGSSLLREWSDRMNLKFESILTNGATES